MADTLFYPAYDGGDNGKAIMIHKKTKTYVYCDIYNYEYEDNCCVFNNQININWNKKYKIWDLNTEFEGVFVKNPSTEKYFIFRNGLTLAQALGYHENNNVDASI